VGDSADGYPGLPGWGPKAASAIFSAFAHFEGIPLDWRHWPPGLRGAQRLSDVLRGQWNEAILYRTLATLRTDCPIPCDAASLAWRGVDRPAIEAICDELGTDQGIVRV